METNLFKPASFSCKGRPKQAPESKEQPGRRANGIGQLSGEMRKPQKLHVCPRAAARRLLEEIFFRKSKTCFNEKIPMAEDEEAAQSHTFLDFSAMFVQKLDCQNVAT